MAPLKNSKDPHLAGGETHTEQLGFWTKIRKKAENSSYKRASCPIDKFLDKSVKASNTRK